MRSTDAFHLFLQSLNWVERLKTCAPDMILSLNNIFLPFFFCFVFLSRSFSFLILFKNYTACYPCACGNKRMETNISIDTMLIQKKKEDRLLGREIVFSCSYGCAK